MLSSELLPQEFLSQLSMVAQGWSRAVLCSAGTALDSQGISSTLENECSWCGSVAFAIGSYQVLSCLSETSINPSAKLEIPSLTDNLF